MKTTADSLLALTNLISSVQMFADIPTTLLKEIVATATIHHGKPGETMPLTDNEYIGLLEGEIQLRRDRDNHPIGVLKINAEPDHDIALVYALHGSHLYFDRRSKVIFLDGARIDMALSRTAVLNELADRPPALRKRLFWLTETPVFAPLSPRQLIDCAQTLTPQLCEAGSAIITQGEQGNHFYIIESGTAEVWRKDPMEDEPAQCVATLSKGDVFGEEALLQNGLRNATVRMTKTGGVLQLDHEMFDKYLRASFLDEVEAEPALELINGGAKLLDCRFEMEYEMAHIPGAKLIPLDHIREQFSQLDPQHKHVVYCRTGRRSKAAAYLLAQQGISAVSMKGGINKWPFDIEGDSDNH